MTKYEIYELIIDRLWDEVGDLGIIELEYVEREKTNGVYLDGINVIVEGVNLAPCVYTGHLLDETVLDDDGIFTYPYEESYISRVVSIIAENIRYAVEEARTASHSIDLDDLNEETLIPVIVNTADNYNMLENTPHKEFLDLAIVIRMVWKINGRFGSALVNNALFQTFDMSFEDMLLVAMSNYTKMFPPKLENIFEKLSGIEQDYPIHLYKEELPMFIISNDDYYFGASVLIDADYMLSVAEFVKDDYYIIPSSQHELIIIPKGEVTECEYIREMIKQVNDEVVPKSEILSDTLYYYDTSKGRVEIAS